MTDIHANKFLVKIFVECLFPQIAPIFFSFFYLQTEHLLFVFFISHSTNMTINI